MRIADVADLDGNEPARPIGAHGGAIWQRIGEGLAGLLGDQDPGLEVPTVASLMSAAVPLHRAAAPLATETEAAAEAERIVASCAKLTNDWLALPVADSGPGVSVTVPAGESIALARAEAAADGGLSWGFSPRALVAVASIHGDEEGLVLPPRIAPIQVEVSATEAEAEAYAGGLVEYLQGPALRVSLASSNGPDWKQLGIPLRLEVGASEAARKDALVQTRIDPELQRWPRMGLKARLIDALDGLQLTLRNRAKDRCGAG